MFSHKIPPIGGHHCLAIWQLKYNKKLLNKKGLNRRNDSYAGKKINATIIIESQYTWSLIEI